VILRRRLIASLLFGLSVALSACLAGGGKGESPSNTGPLPGGIFTIGPSTSGGSAPGSGEAPTPGSGSAAAAVGGSDTMPPRADAGDCMTIGIDGTIYCGPPKREACRVSYVPTTGLKVMAGQGTTLPPIGLEKSVFDGRFYAEIGSAPIECEESSCWTWESLSLGDVLLMRLSRLQSSAPALVFHKDTIVELPGADGANFGISGVLVKDEDTIEFYATLSESKPEGYSETLVPLTDTVWTQFGIKCEMGGFRIDTGTTYEIKPGGIRAPGLDSFLLDGTIKR